MTMTDRARTLVKTARFDRSLAEAIMHSRHDVYSLGLELGNAIKYASYETGTHPFLLMVSQQADRSPSPRGYNAIVSATSYNDLQNQLLVEGLSRDTGIDFALEPPRALVEMMSGIDTLFPAFVRDPHSCLRLWDAVRVRAA